jgi:hypothetical protein
MIKSYYSEKLNKLYYRINFTHNGMQTRLIEVSVVSYENDILYDNHNIKPLKTQSFVDFIGNVPYIADPDE